MGSLKVLPVSVRLLSVPVGTVLVRISTARQHCTVRFVREMHLTLSVLLRRDLCVLTERKT